MALAVNDIKLGPSIEYLPYIRAQNYRFAISYLLFALKSNYCYLMNFKRRVIVHVAKSFAGLTLLWPDFLTDMQHCAKNVFIKPTILVIPIKLNTKMFLIS